MPTTYSATNPKKFLDADGLTYFSRKLNNYPTNNVIAAVVDGVQDALDEKMDADARGAANGVASLDANGKVPSSQLPSTTNTTYTITQDASDGHKFTLVGSDGSSVDITIPDEDTKYTLSSLGIGNVKNYDQSKAIQSITRSGTTFTYTCLDGTTGTFTQQDNNTWTAMVGASASANGSAGYVPAPPKDGYNTKFLRADGTWVVPPDSNDNTTYTIEQDATDGHTFTMTGSDGTSVTITVPDDNTTYAEATQSVAGLMSASDKTKLDGITAGANVATFAYDSTNKKFTKTIDGITTDVVTVATLKTALQLAKGDVGLGNVDNTSDANKPISTATQAALNGKLDTSLKGANSGLAELDSSGKVPSSQLPSFVDDVLEYTNKASFPATGESGKIYVDKATNLTWRWSGSAYVEISPSLALGTTSSTAFRGDYGNAAYAHAVTNKGSAFASGLYKITTNSEGHVTSATAVAKSDITGLGIPGSDTNTTYTLTQDATDGHKFTFAGSDGTSVTITIPDNNTTYSTMGAASSSAAGSSGLVPAPASGAQGKFLRGDATWQTPTDTKNTAGSTDSSSKLFLIGATTQAANPQTYSQDTAYVGTDGCLYSGGSKVLTSHQDISGKKNTQSAVSDPTASGTSLTFIDSISQNAQGVITPTKKTVSTMGAASADAAGSAGLVPAPAKGDQAKFLRADGTWVVPTDTNTDTKVTQTATTTNAAYELLFSNTADNTTRTEAARKTSTLTYNPSTKALSTGGTVNGYSLAAASAKAVDTSISDASTSANLPTSAAVAAFVEGKGYKTTDNDTKNTAGSTDSSKKLFLIGAESQAANPQTYSHDTAYVGTDGCLYSGGSKVLTSHQSNASLGQGYGTCATAAATAAKAVTLSNYVLATGGIVAVKFTYDVPASATLNVNSKGAKAIYNKGAAITAGIILAGDLAVFMYDGTRYHLIAIDRASAADRITEDMIDALFT